MKIVSNVSNILNTELYTTWFDYFNDKIYIKRYICN